MRFRDRLALFLLILLGAVQLTTMAVVYSYARVTAEREGARELALAGEALVHNLDIIEERVTTGVNVLSLDYGLRRAIAEADRETAFSALRNHGRRIKARRMMLVDLEGAVTVDTAGDEAPRGAFQFPDLIEAAWNGEPASALASVDGATTWVIVSPVEAPDVIGYVVAFAPVDSVLLGALAKADGGPVSVALVSRERGGQWRVISSGGENARPEGSAIDFDPAAAREGRATRSGGAFLYASTALMTGAGSAPIYALHEFRLDHVLAGNWSLFGPLVVILGVGMLIAIGGALMIARSVSTPLEQLALSAGALRGGDYCAEFSMPRGAREFSELGGALRDAARAVRDREEALVGANRQLERARDEARDADRAKSQFIATMSHELRTPLNAMIGFADAIRKEALGPVGARDYLQYADYIATGGRSLLDLHNAILDLARLEAGKFDVTMDRCDLAEIADAATEALRPLADAKGVRLTLRAPSTRVMASVDAIALGKALTAIIHNAVKFTPAGGHAEVTLHVEDGGAVIEVVDTGVGMDSADIPRLMRPFQRGHSQYSSNYAGAGLGLSVADGVVRLMGGRLAIASELMGGCRVAIHLRSEPAAVQKAAA